MASTFRKPGWMAYSAAGALVLAVCAALMGLPFRAPAPVAAPPLLLSVLIAARLFGTGPALLASAIGAGMYIYYFLPPSGFWIEEPADWVAFLAFVVTAIVTGELASRAQREREVALAGRLEIERLYQELQAAFDRASEAEAARRNEEVKAALLDALTHNLRTPLTSIKAAVTALLSAGSLASDGPLGAAGSRDLLEVIDEESDRLNRFIEGLSTTGESGDPALRVHAADVRGIIEAGVRRAEALTREHPVLVDGEGHLPQVLVDASAATEVLYMLLDNASKYAPRGTPIVVGAHRQDGRMVRVSVADSGPGIAESERERVFEKFYRIPGRDPQDPRRLGVGLGLSIARRLVEAQGGRMWLEAPAEGTGTVVAMCWPVAEPNAD